MRKGLHNIVMAFKAGQSKSDGHYSTDGRSLFHYDTALITRDADRFILNESRYSKTTSMAQHDLRGEFGFHAKVSGLQRGVRHDDLVNAASVTS